MGMADKLVKFLERTQKTQWKAMNGSMNWTMNSECVVSATTTSLAHMAALLGALTVVNSKVVVSIADDGLNFITENSHVCRAEVMLEKSLFTTYTFNKSMVHDDDGDDDDDDDDGDDDEETKFTVDLVPIVESLSLANNSQLSATHCTMIYQGQGHPFILVFEDSKMTERCEFSTYVNLDFEANTMGFELRQDEITMEGIVKADVLYDALKDLKDIGTEEIFIYTSTQNKRNKKLTIITKSEVGNSTLHLPNDRSILESLVVSTPSRVNVSCFKYSLFSMALRAMKLSNKCKFKTDSKILSINLLSHYGNDIPKNYTGTVFNFKLLQLSDKDEEVDEYVKENDEHTDEPSRAIVAPVDEEMNEDVGIEVPVFL